jgi:putative ABC transport system substrate-binding protein
MFDLRRRELLTLLGGAAVGWPLGARAQQPTRLRRIGILLFADADKPIIAPFLQELESLGYVDGKTAAIEYPSAEGKFDRLPELAAELVRRNPEVIFSYGGEQAPIVKQATGSIPIVVVVSNDPVASGLVESLARPGGNVTGVTYVHDQLAGKTIELLKDAAPRVARAAILWNPNHADPEFRETERAARTLDMPLQSLEIREAHDFEGAFQSATREHAGALIVVGSRIIAQHRQRIGDFAAQNRLILTGTPQWVPEIGGLLSYGPNAPELHRRAAYFVDKILKGAKPKDLPMEQPTGFVLTINLKMAKALGLDVPPTLLARADRVIE